MRCSMKVLRYDCFAEECLGYGPVVPFPAYGFAALVSNKYCTMEKGAGRDGRVGASVGSTGRVGAASFFLATNRD